MMLNEIKSKVSLKNMTMTELAKVLNLNRRTMYIKIKAGDKKTIERIKKILN